MTTKKVTKKVTAKPSPDKPDDVAVDLLDVHKTAHPVGAIHGSLINVMRELGAIGKDSQNKTQNFKFRGIDAAYNALHPLMAKHAIFTVPRDVKLLARKERRTRNGGVIGFTLIKVKYDFVSGIDGSLVTVGPLIGEGMDSGDKGVNKALSVAHKYALFQLFLIPTEKTDDPDFDSYELAEDEPEPVSKPTKKKVTKKKVARKTPVQEEDGGSDDTLTVTCEEDAAFVADQLIDLANMHKSSTESLEDFWKKNPKPIRLLKAEYPKQYSRVVDHFNDLIDEIEGEE